MAITISGSGITSANIADGTIVNADINSSAAIAGTKVSGSFGKVLQVVNATLTSVTSTTSTSFVDSGLTVNITPATGSKVLITVSTMIGGSDQGTGLGILRGSTNLVSSTAGGSADTNNAWAVYSTDGSSPDREAMFPSLTYLDSSPGGDGSTAITYKVQYAAFAGGTAYFNRWGLNTNNTGVSSITVIEIGA